MQTVPLGQTLFEHACCIVCVWGGLEQQLEDKLKLEELKPSETLYSCSSKHSVSI